MTLFMLGIDFRTASLDLRERLALTREETGDLLAAVHDEQIFPEAVVLSTCNRTEFYLVSDEENEGSVAHLLAHHADVKGLDRPVDASVLRRLDGEAAVRHLFRVAASLESQIVGEREIQGQVKDAYRLACRWRTARFLCHKLMHASFAAAKRVMTDTALGRGTASVSQAAVDLAREVFTSLEGKTVLMLGAGQTAELACQALVRAGVGSVIVANRTLQGARELADRFADWRQSDSARHGDGEEESPVHCPALVKLLAECSIRTERECPPQPPLRARAIPLEDVPAAIGDVDLVICSTAASQPVLTAEQMRPALAGLQRSLLMIDISVPRNVEPAVGELPNVVLHNIDALESLVERNLVQRRGELPRAEAIVENEVQRFTGWLATLGVVPTIKLLTERISQFQQAEIERYQKHFAAADREQLHEFARTLCGKILHDPISFLRRLDAQGEDRSLSSVSVVRELFNLGNGNGESHP